MDKKSDSAQKPGSTAALREARRAEALRANLQRRKIQQRARAQDTPSPKEKD